jgi:hypothetical protein
MLTASQNGVPDYRSKGGTITSQRVAQTGHSLLGSQRKRIPWFTKVTNCQAASPRF